MLSSEVLHGPRPAPGVQCWLSRPRQQMRGARAARARKSRKPALQSEVDTRGCDGSTGPLSSIPPPHSPRLSRTPPAQRHVGQQAPRPRERAHSFLHQARAEKLPAPPAGFSGCLGGPRRRNGPLCRRTPTGGTIRAACAPPPPATPTPPLWRIMCATRWGARLRRLLIAASAATAVSAWMAIPEVAIGVSLFPAAAAGWRGRHTPFTAVAIRRMVHIHSLDVTCSTCGASW